MLIVFHASDHPRSGRWQPITSPHISVPKVLLNVGGKPIVGHILDRLIENGFDEATIVVGYLGEKIKEYVVRNYCRKQRGAYMRVNIGDSTELEFD